MLKYLVYLYRKTIVWRLLLTPIVWLHYNIFNFLSDEYFIKIRYKWKLWKFPNINNPKLFTEKIQWLKINDRNKLYTICADKYKVREYIAGTIWKGFLIPLVFETKNIEDINKKKLPDYPVIIKTNHDSWWSTAIINKEKIDYKTLRWDLKRKLSRNYYYAWREREYRNIEPRIIIEKLIKDSSWNNLLNDYKIYCFNWEPKYIQTIFDRWDNTRETWYNKDREIQNIHYYSNKQKEVPCPKNFKLMLEIARKLSKPFAYVRVDLYNINGKILFWEMTFHPYWWFMKWQPKSIDTEFWKMIKL